MLFPLIFIGILFTIITFYFVSSRKFNNIIDQKTSSMEEQLNLSFIFINIKKTLTIYYLTFTALLTITFYALEFNTVILALAIILVILPPLWIKRYRKKQLDKLEQQLPDALILISGALRSGASLNVAFQQLMSECLPPLKQEISLVLREQKLGVPINEALMNLQTRVPLNSITLMATSIRIATETGGELAETLTKAASTLRQINQAEGKIGALTAQGRMQAWVVGLMPVGLILVLSKMEPEAMSQLWSTPAGWVALAGIIIFEICGILLILKIVNIDV